MSFFSTRGGACVTASQAILWGLAKDGGLYVPSMFPQLSSERMASLCGAELSGAGGADPSGLSGGLYHCRDRAVGQRGL